MPESQKAEAELSRTDVAVSKEARADGTLKAPGRRLSESRMRANLMSGSRWLGMETRIWCRVMKHSCGNREQIRMALPKSQATPLTLQG